MGRRRLLGRPRPISLPRRTRSCPGWAWGLRVDCSSRTSRIVRDGDFCSESDETMRNLYTQTTSDVEAVDPLVEARLVECAIGGPSAIKARLSELDREWGCNRVLEVLIASTGHRCVRQPVGDAGDGRCVAPAPGERPDETEHLESRLEEIRLEIGD
jgi:hypothetical protein